MYLKKWIKSIINMSCDKLLQELNIFIKQDRFIAGKMNLITIAKVNSKNQLPTPSFIHDLFC